MSACQDHVLEARKPASPSQSPKGSLSPRGRAKTKCPNGRPTPGQQSPISRPRSSRIAAEPSNRALGRMAKCSTWAADGIAKLARGADSESVRLSALRAILKDRMAIASFADLEGRMAQIEQKLRDRTDTPDQPS